MRPALVATDLDGTFLGAEGLAHPGNLDAAHAITDAGIEFVVATGRPRRSLEALQSLRELNPIVICSNGASIGRLAAPEPEMIHPIDPALVHDFAARLPRALEVSFAVEFTHEWGHEANFPRIPDRDAVVAPLSELLEREPVLKLLVHTRRACTEDLAAVVTEAVGDGLTCTFSWSADHGTVELSAPGVNKGAALAEVIADLGLDPADCAAFGDMPNDLDMLRLVGWPFVMAGSHPTMFDHGFTVIGHHHEGAVGEQLRRYLVPEAG